VFATSHHRMRSARRTVETAAGERHTVRANRPSRQRQFAQALAEQGVPR